MKRRIRTYWAALGLLCALTLLLVTQAARADEATPSRSVEASVESAEPHHSSLHEPVIENWWSWKNRQVAPPFGFALINFAVFLLILHLTLGKQLRSFLKNRHEEIRAEIQQAEQHKEKELAAVALFQSLVREFPTKKQELFGQMQEEARAEMTRTLATADAQISRLHKDAASTLEQEKRKALLEIQTNAAEAAIVLATALLKKFMQPSDQQRLLHTPLIQLERAAQKTANASVSKRGVS